MFTLDERVQYKNSRGVYCIWNDTREDMAYVGSSNDIRTRVRGHLGLLINGKHGILALQQDYDKGHEFRATVLRFVDPLYVLCLIEQEKMDLMVEHGYTLYNRSPAFFGDRDKAHAESCRRFRDVSRLYLLDPDLALVDSKRSIEFHRSLPRW